MDITSPGGLECPIQSVNNHENLIRFIFLASEDVRIAFQYVMSEVTNSA